MKELWTLFLAFARIGEFTFGGGYAMLPMLQREVVQNRKWATEEEVLDYFAIGQCTPGVIFVNTATFIGYRRKGLPGAICATAGSVFPSLVIITLIAALLQNFAHLQVVQDAFGGIRVVVGVLILQAVAGMWKKSVVDKLGILLAAAAFAVATFTELSPVWMVLVGGAAGICIQALAERKKGGR